VDDCGICGGASDTCEKQTDSVKLTAKFGYNRFLTIPAKSTSIHLHRHKNSNDLGCMGSQLVFLNVIN
jgi:hypothetical protein